MKIKFNEKKAKVCITIYYSGTCELEIEKNSDLILDIDYVHYDDDFEDEFNWQSVKEDDDKVWVGFKEGTVAGDDQSVPSYYDILLDENIEVDEYSFALDYDHNHNTLDIEIGDDYLEIK